MEGLRRKYDYAVATAKSVGMVGSIVEHDGRLFLRGSVDARDKADRIWHAIKLVRTWRHEVIADIQVTGGHHAPREHRPDIKLAPRPEKMPS
jgi:hypothetical protein